MTDPSARGALRVWRDDAGLSQRELAEQLGLKQPAIAQWETGGRPDLAKALELQSLTLGRVPATEWGYTEEQVARVLRAAQFPGSLGHTASDFAPPAPPAPPAPEPDDAADDEPSGPVLVVDGYSQVTTAARG